MGMDFTVCLLTESEEASDSAYFVQHTVLVSNSMTTLSQDGTAQQMTPQRKQPDYSGASPIALNVPFQQVSRDSKVPWTKFYVICLF